jgi:spore coat polysaccharide biosynthesis protein SpsF
LKVAAIIQARMGSTRLPGKVLMDLGGQTTLCRVVRRLRRAASLHEIAVATTDSHYDEPIMDVCRKMGLTCVTGSEQDVLDRYFQAVDRLEAEVIVRITSDCPLIDPQLVDQVVHQLVEQKAEFASNVISRTYPRGLDTEAFTREALKRAWELSDQPHQREHVTPLFYERPGLFRTVSVSGNRDCSQYRWTLDTPEDLCVIRGIYTSFKNRDDFGWREAVALMERSPELLRINAQVVQKPMQETVHLSQL